MDMREKFYKISSSIIGGDSSTILCHEYCWYKSEITRKSLTNSFFIGISQDAWFDNSYCKGNALLFNESSIK